MKTHLRTYTGTGAKFLIKDLPLIPSFAIVVPRYAQMPTFHSAGLWVERTTPMGAADSFKYGFRFFGDRVLVGSDARINELGKTFTVLFVEFEPGEMPAPSWCGNATAGRVIDLVKPILPVGAFVKRDSVITGVIKIAGSPTAATDGSVVPDSIALESGRLVLSAADQVNEWKPAIGVGEGIAGVAFSADQAVVGTYVGTGAAASVALGAEVEMAFVWRSDGTGGVHILLDKANGAKPCTAAAPEMTVALRIGTLVFGGPALNASAVPYSFMAIRAKRASTKPVRPALRVAGRRAVTIPGRGVIGSVDFGTGLNLNGPLTLTWTGKIPGEVKPDYFDGVLLAKCAAADGSKTAGSASWGLIGVSRLDPDNFGWGGPHMVAIVCGRVSHVNSLTDATWRTGIIAPGGIHHHALVHVGNGRWYYYIDGLLRKQREQAADAVASSVTHRVTMGSRWTGSGYTNNSRMLALGASVYSRALSHDEVSVLAERELRGSIQDIANGLAERWSSDGISGNTWNPEVSASNKGTLLGAAQVTVL